MRAALIALCAVAVAKLAGLYTVGLVGSGSMEPGLPQGSVFLAVAGAPEAGDLVVFEAAGERVVHRVVAVQADGLLVTKGDANEADDVASGLGPVDPRHVQVVPQPGGRPLALSGAWMRPALVVALQVAVLAVGLRGLLRRPAGRPQRLRPHHAVVAAAGLLLLASPLHHDTVDAAQEVGVRASVVPIVARVTAPGVDTVLEVGALAEESAAAAGRVEVVYAPALPGAAWLTGFGATAAALPAVLLLAALAAAMRLQGW
jgi:hypothetical protein